jgi:hypothetical protein
MKNPANALIICAIRRDLSPKFLKSGDFQQHHAERSSAFVKARDD